MIKNRRRKNSESAVKINRTFYVLSAEQAQQGLLFHSDRGAQYSSLAFRQCPADVGIKQSQSRAGKCTDNAVTERFFRSLKTEKLYRENYATKTAALLGIAEYIEDFYNPKRLHSAWGNLSPMMKQNNRV
ncbi:DDE-type integrase/transposase/recombinase [Aggregatibacter actinomycetemcomitans]|nr:DDE-type integrase/transposase/recombinase [Aggregatibacter actinomycetemcomitans]